MSHNLAAHMRAANLGSLVDGCEACNAAPDIVAKTARVLAEAGKVGIPLSACRLRMHFETWRDIKTALNMGPQTGIGAQSLLDVPVDVTETLAPGSVELSWKVRA